MIHGSYMDHNDSWTIHHESFANICIYTLSLIPRWYYSNLTGRQRPFCLLRVRMAASSSVILPTTQAVMFSQYEWMNECHTSSFTISVVFYVGGGSTVDNYVFAKRVDEHVSDVVISNVFDEVWCLMTLDLCWDRIWEWFYIWQPHITDRTLQDETSGEDYWVSNPPETSLSPCQPLPASLWTTCKSSSIDYVTSWTNLEVAKTCYSKSFSFFLPRKCFAVGHSVVLV